MTKNLEPDNELTDHIATFWAIHMCCVDDKTEEHLDDCMRGIANAPPATTLLGLHLRADGVWQEMFEHMTKDTPRSPLEQAIISVLRDAYELGKPKIEEDRSP